MENIERLSRKLELLTDDTEFGCDSGVKFE